MNILDKAIAAISPEAALRREVAKKKLDFFNALGSGSGYGRHGASYAKKSLSAWVANGRSADEDIVDNLETLRSRSRDLYMGAPLATGALKTVRTNVVGSGLSLSAQPDAAFLGLSDEQAREWAQTVEREWKLWAETTHCDAERRHTFYQLQSLVLLSALMSGDVFVTLPVIRRPGSVYDLRIALIEADRVCNPMHIPSGADILGGVEVGPYGEPVAYWVAKHHPHAAPRFMTQVKQEWKRVLAYGATTGRRNVLHLMSDVERPAQRRGVPFLAPVIESLKQLSRYSDAELMASVVAGMFTVFVKTNTPQTPLGSVFNSPLPQNVEPNAYELGNGAVVALDEGEDVSTASPGRPNTAYGDFVDSVCRQVGASLELSHELLMKHFSSSYSASRGALLEAWKMFRMRADWLVGGFCQPTYEEWLAEAILKGRVQAPGFFDDPAIRAAWSNAEWFGDSHGQLDPVAEVEAAKLRVEECFSTREREAAELTGLKFDVIMAARKREEELRREAGLAADPAAAFEAPGQAPGKAPSEDDDEEEEKDASD